jgi:hypothetical protein
MHLELRVGGTPTWDSATSIAQLAERAGIAGLTGPETSQAPWMTMAFAGRATERLQLSTGVATAFTRSPMVTACEAWKWQETPEVGSGSVSVAKSRRMSNAATVPSLTRPAPVSGTTSRR